MGESDATDPTANPKRPRQYRKKEVDDNDDRRPAAQPERRRDQPRRSHSRSRSRSAERGRDRHRSSRRSRSRSPERKPPVGVVLRGKVVSIRDFGCFVRLDKFGARDGLLHISQAAQGEERTTADDLRARLPVGKSVWVRVTKVEDDGKLGLSCRGIDQATGQASMAPKGVGYSSESIRQTGAPTPTGPVPELFSIHRATVMSSTDFGVFVRLLPSNYDAMVHTTQLDEARLRAANARMPSDVYANGDACRVKISAVDGYSRKAKLQASIKYADQATGKDLDPKHTQLLMDLTTRGMASEMNGRWNANASRSHSPERDEAAARLAEGEFFAARHWAGPREGYLFTRGVAGQGYYRDTRGAPRAMAAAAGTGSGALLQQVLGRLQQEDEARRERKREKKAKKERKKERKKEKKAAKKARKEERREASSSSSRSSSGGT